MKRIQSLENNPSADNSIGRFSINGSVLKWIAVITMVIDHTGVAVIARVMASAGPESTVPWETIYSTMRMIGRISFPLFCFLLTEGFFHTRSRRKYGIRLLIFALLSEVPFDLAINGRLLDFSGQNIFFTLFIGLITMDLMEWKQDSFMWKIAACAVCASAAELLHTDYGWYGIVLITVLYLFHENRKQLCISGAVLSLLELPASLAFLPVFYYNGRRGKQSKYFFYIFYPAHLLALYFAAEWILKM